MGIKLRVRVAGEGGTQKLEVPEVCTLGQLRKAVATKCMGDSCAPSDVAVTLNRTDDVGAHGAVNESATLRACGIARGDLIHVFQVSVDITFTIPPNPNDLSYYSATNRFFFAPLILLGEDVFFFFFSFSFILLTPEGRSSTQSHADTPGTSSPSLSIRHSARKEPHPPRHPRPRRRRRQ